jgi:ABC-type transport system, involved in lipoprotein release, permease component
MSSLSIIGVGVGVATLIVVLSVMTGLRKQLKEKILGITPHILITKYGGVIEGWEKFVDEVKKIKGVRDVFPLIVGNSILKKDEITTSVVLQCIPSKYVKDALFFRKFLKYGEIFSDGKVNVGHQLAKNLI